MDVGGANLDTTRRCAVAESKAKKIRGPDPVEGVPAYCKLSCDLLAAKLALMTAAIAVSAVAAFLSAR